MGQNIYREQDFPLKSVAENNKGNFILMDAVCQVTYLGARALDSALPRSLPESQGKNATGEQTHVVEQPHSADAPTPTTYATLTTGTTGEKKP